MPIFFYESIDANGKTEEGLIEAADLASAVREIEADQVTLTSIRKLDIQSIADYSTAAEEPYRSDRFTHQLEEAFQLLDARIANTPSIIALLEATRLEPPKSIPSASCQRLLKALKAERPFKEIAQDPKLIDLIPALLRAANENSGSQQQAVFLNSIARFDQVRRGWARKLAFPMFFLIVTIILFTLMNVFIVPIFESMYAEFGISLPTPTALLFQLSNLFRRWSLWIPPTAILTFGLVTIARRYAQRYSLGKRLFGSLFSGSNADLIGMSRYIAALSEVLELKVPLTPALAIAGRCTGSYFYEQRALSWARDAANSGIAKSQYSKSMPPMLLMPLRTLERSLDSAPNSQQIQFLRDLSQLYLERVIQRPSFGHSIIGPFMVIALGCFMGFFIIALFMPLMTLTTSLA